MNNSVYSFKDVHASIDGPGGNFPLAGDEAGAAKEGISIEPTGDINTMTGGADGSYMHSLSGDESGTVTVRLLKTSSVNAQLQALCDYQRTSSARWGRNTITIRDVARGDTVTCSGVAFVKPAPIAYTEQAGIVEWSFHSGKIKRQLGSGTPEI